MFSKELFGTRLREIRKKQRETQEGLAAVLGVSHVQISDMEKGKKTTTLEKFALICEHYQGSAYYLLGLSDGPTPINNPKSETQFRG